MRKEVADRRGGVVCCVLCVCVCGRISEVTSFALWFFFCCVLGNREGCPASSLPASGRGLPLRAAIPDRSQVECSCGPLGSERVSRFCRPRDSWAKEVEKRRGEKKKKKKERKKKEKRRGNG